jgi:hypothetical protein
MNKSNHDLAISGSVYNKYNSNCVYAWKRGDEWLYVGTSSKGLSRLFGHTTIDIVEKVQDNDEIIVWLHEDSFQAQLDEVELILKYTPKHNKQKDASVLFSNVITKNTPKDKKHKKSYR